MARMNHDAAREWLVAVQRNLIRLAELVHDLRVITLGAERVCPASLRFDALVRAGESAGGEQQPRSVRSGRHRPGWKLFVMVPNISFKPTGCAAASPNAQIIRCSSSPSSLPTAAAAPNTPVVPVMCQPAS